MIRLSAFADEISPQPEEQLAALRAEGIGYLDLRSAWDTNLLDLTDHQVFDIKQAIDEAGLHVAAIGSPVGKVPIDTPMERVMSGLERAIDLARFLQTPYIRIFSFSQPAAQPAPAPETYRDEVMQRLRQMRDRAEEQDIILLHENDTGFYGDTIARCVDVMQSLHDAHFEAVFDPHNLINSGERPYPGGYRALRRWIRYVHVKDMRADHATVVAGEGLADWPAILHDLHDDGYDGFLSLEPHLRAGGPYGGFSGPDLFHVAAQALKHLLDQMDWEYE